MVDPRSCNSGFTSGSDDAVPAEGADERRARKLPQQKNRDNSEEEAWKPSPNDHNNFVLRSVAGLFTKAC